MKYEQKDEVTMQHNENVRILRAHAENVKQRVLNIVLPQHEAEFNAALNAGGLAKISGSREELDRLFDEASRRALGAGNADGS